MVWQDAISSGPGGPAFDAERERERRLAAQARAGAEWALTALIARYQPTVVRYLTRLCGNPAQARSLAERIFQRMERRLHGPQGADNLRLWLLRASTEAGLDALRHPQRGSAARLGAGRVAGLLTRQTGQKSAGDLQSGLGRLRQGRGSASHQARPLVWAEETPAASAANPASAAPTNGSADGHLDDDLDRLDPRDAFRHRMVRVTLAELPYGDAQCLALHLVAGLNQAEVARALGLTNSAARKRIVHGLAQFSERYTQAMQSLGVPEELAFGDALPRPLEEPEPVAEPAPAPVIVSSRPPQLDEIEVGEPDWLDEADEANGPSAHGEDRIVEGPARVAAAAEAAGLADIAYLSDDTSEASILPQPATQPESFSTHMRDSETSAGAATLDGATFGDGAAWQEQQGYQPVIVAVEDPAPAPATIPLAASESVVEPATLAGPVSGGLVTRLADDAIIGPIVDALPVAPAPILPEAIGLRGPRSVPLALELNSSAMSESASGSSSVMMNWLDETGLMTPLSFESIAVSSGALPISDTSATDAPTDGAPLGLEAIATPTGALTSPAQPVVPDALLSFEAVALPASAPDYDATHDTGAALEYELAPAAAIKHTAEAPATTAALAQVGAVEPLALLADPAPQTTQVFAAPDAAPSAPTARSLEDLWDELSDNQ